MEKEAEAQQRQVPWGEMRVARCDLAVLVLRLAPLGPSRRLHFGVPNGSGSGLDWGGPGLPTRSLTPEWSSENSGKNGSTEG